MNETQFENEVYKMLVNNQMKSEGLGFHKKFKKLAKKIVKKVKKAAIPAAKISMGFLGGGPAGAAVVAGRLAVNEVGKKKAKKAAKKARKQSVAANKVAITSEMLAQDGINFDTPRANNALRGFVGQQNTSPMKYVLPAVGGVAVLILLLNR